MGKFSSGALFVSGAVVCMAAATSASAQSKSFDIPAQSVERAIGALGRQAGIQILAARKVTHAKRANAVHGAMTVDQALPILLQGTGLVARQTGPQTYSVILATTSSSSETAARTEQADAAVGNDIVVTATKRPENVRSIAGSITVQTGAQLEAEGAQSFADYLTRTPGVVFNATTPGISAVTIRGVSTTTGLDQGQGTTGYFINDVPLTDPYFSVAIPDIDTFDVDNVVVLQGPQGTLFGSASLGGAINYQAAKPDLTHVQAHVQATMEGVTHGTIGGSGKIMLNLPIVTDKLAIRAVFYDREDPGFIDNIGTGQRDSNLTRSRGGRVLATWAAGPNTKLNYLFLYQDEKTSDNGDVEPVLGGPYAKNTLLPELFDFKTMIHNLRLDQDFGFATLTATGTYHDKRSHFMEDLTASFGPLLGGLSRPVALPQAAFSRGTTFEVRLASPARRRFEYLIGAYYDRTRESFVDNAVAPNAANVIEKLYAGSFGAGVGARSAPGNSIYFTSLPFVGKEYAVFGEANYHLTDTLKVTLGGRGFKTESTNTSTTANFLELILAGKLSSTISGSQKDSGFTPKGSITWTPSDQLMIYGLVSKGFRFGGPNINPSTPTTPIPRTFGSDSLINYELGTRTNFFDRKLQLDGTIYYVDWSNIQLRLATATGLAYAANAGKAHNYGFEGTTTLRPIDGLTLQGNLTYLDATLRTPFSPGPGRPVIPAGTTLPGASKWEVSDSIGYLWHNLTFLPSLLLQHRYISRANSNFSFAGTQGGYSVFDLRAGFLYKGVGVTGFIQNVADKRGITNISAAAPLTQYIVRPRTFGITFDLKR